MQCVTLELQVVSGSARCRRPSEPGTTWHFQECQVKSLWGNTLHLYGTSWAGEGQVADVILALVAWNRFTARPSIAVVLTLLGRGTSGRKRYFSVGWGSYTHARLRGSFPGLLKNLLAAMFAMCR